MPIDELQFLGKALQPLGLDFVDLSKLRKVGQEIASGGKSFSERSAAALKASKDQDAIDKKAAKRQEAYAAIMNQLSLLWESFMVQVGNELAFNLLPLLTKELIPVFKSIVGWLKELDWKHIFKEAVTIIKGMIFIFKKLYNFVASIFEDIGKSIGGMFSTAMTFVDAFVDLFNGDFDAAERKFIEVIKNMGKIFFDLLMVMPRAIANVFGARGDLDKIMDDAFGIVKNWASKALNAFKSLAAAVVTMYDSVWNTIKLAGSVVFTWFKEALGSMFERIISLVEPIVKYIPGSVGAGARSVVEDLKEFFKPEVSQTINTPPGMTSVTTRTPNVNIPGNLTTRNPTSEELQKEQLKESRKLREILTRSGSIGDPRTQYLAASAGG